MRCLRSLSNFTASAPPESLECNCMDVVRSQPHVLIIPKGRRVEEYPNWKDDLETLDLSRSTILPFVNRLPTLTCMVKALVQNYQGAKKVKERSDVVRSLQLVGSGALYGAGKTRISPVLYRCLQLVFEPQHRVVFCQFGCTDSLYATWADALADLEGMDGIREKLNRDMTWQMVIKATADHLATKNMLLYIHFDEFIPFDENGALENTKENFYLCWRRMLLPILKTPQLLLYISGRLPYFDSIGSAQPGGQSPCNVFSVQLDLFSADFIHEALQKISIPSAVTSGATTTLSEAMNALLPGIVSEPDAVKLLVPKRDRYIAQRLYELTGGVPRFIQHALHGLLVDPVIHAALFVGNNSGYTDLHLDSLFRKGGALYSIVTKQASIHFGHAVGVTNLLEGGSKMRDEHVAGLLVLAFLQGQACHVEPEDLEHLLTGTQSIRNGKKLPFLFREALYWGFHRDLDQKDGKVKFPVPAAVLAGLKPVLMDFADSFPPGLQKLKEEKRDNTGKTAEHAVEMALIFHRLLAGVFEHHTWLRINKSSAVVSAAPLPISAARFTSWGKQSLFELPRLPRVNGSGKLSKVGEVEEVTYSSHGTANVKRMCPPYLAGEFISNLSGDAFHALTTAPLSASADFIVRHGGDVTHLQVRDTQDLDVQKILMDCGRVAAVMEGAPDLHHTLVWVLMQSDGLKDAKKSLACLKRLLGSDESAEKIAAAVMSGKMATLLSPYEEKEKAQRRSKRVAVQEPAVGGVVPRRSAAGKNKENVLAGVQLLRSRKLNVAVLSEKDRDAFLQYNKIAHALLTGEGASVRVVK